MFESRLVVENENLDYYPVSDQEKLGKKLSSRVSKKLHLELFVDNKIKLVQMPIDFQSDQLIHIVIVQHHLQYSEIINIRHSKFIDHLLVVVSKTCQQNYLKTSNWGV